MNKLLTAAAALALAAASVGAGPADAPRTPTAAGHFYPARAKEMTALVREQLDQAPPVDLPAGAGVVALLVPHAGLEFSGPTAARAFKALAKGSYDAVVVLGTCHYKQLEYAALYPGAYATPQGAMPYAADLAARLLKATPAIKADAGAHKKEHSIEVELPFLRQALGPVPVVALVMNTEDLDVSRQVGRALAEVSKGRRVLLVASSDQSHYPAGGIGDAVDRTTLAALQVLDPAYFWLTNRFLMNRALPHLAVTYCGEGAVTAVLEAARELGATSVRVLGHINSGDVVSEHEYNHVVGYASALLVREPGVVPGRPALGEKEKKQLLSAARASARAAADGKQAAAPLSADPVFNLPAAVYVTLRGKDGRARGSAGSVEPQESLLEAVTRQAGAAAQAAKSSGDAELGVEIAVLTPARPAKAADVKKGDGVRVERDGKVGVALPGAGRDEALGGACENAGLPKSCWKDAATDVRVFSADTFSE